VIGDEKKKAGFILSPVTVHQSLSYHLSLAAYRFI
jgi:hypothetical protein